MRIFHKIREALAPSIIKAVKAQDYAKITEYIRAGNDINVQDSYGYTALMWAGYHDYTDIVAQLIAADAKLTIQNSDGKTASNCAKVYRNTPSKSKQLIQKAEKTFWPENLNFSNPDPETSTRICFFSDAQFGRNEKIRDYIAQKININAQDENGNTALMFAAREDHAETVQLLIDAGANLNLQDKNGYTALMWAERMRRPTSMSRLIEAGANLDLKDQHENTALIRAADRGNADLVNRLIGARANINAQNQIGMTALMLAITNNRTEIVPILLNAGADVTLENVFGDTALMIAASYRSIYVNPEDVQLLLDAGADLNLQNKNGDTALFKAVKADNRKAAQILINAGADVNFNSAGQKRSPLMWAAIYGHTEIAKLLIDAGAKLDALDGFGNTALKLAEEKKYPEIVQLLTEAQAQQRQNGAARPGANTKLSGNTNRL